MNFNRNICVDQFVAKGRRAADSVRIISMLCVPNGGVNLLLGTSSGEIVVIPDRLLLPKSEIKVQRFVLQPICTVTKISITVLEFDSLHRR